MSTSSLNKSIYLDTSVLSALFDERTPERKNMTETLWGTLPQHNVFISTLVRDEV